MNVIFKDFAADAFGEKTTALINEYTQACRKQLPGEDNDLPRRIALWHRQSASNFRKFHHDFLENRLCNGTDLRAVLTFCMAFLHSYGQSSLADFYERLVDHHLSINPRHVMLGVGLPPLMPLFDAKLSVIRRLVHRLYITSEAGKRFDSSIYARCGFEIFGKAQRSTLGTDPVSQCTQEHIDNIRANQRPQVRGGANFSGDVGLYDLFVAVFKGQVVHGVTLDQVSRYLIQDILNGRVTTDNELATCVKVAVYPIGLLCHLEGVGMKRLIKQLRIVMTAICQALKIDAVLGDAVFRGVLINLFYFDPEALRRLAPARDEVSGQAIRQHLLIGDQHRKLLGGPLALIYHPVSWNPQSLLAFQLDCLGRAGFNIGFDDALGGGATHEVQANLLAREGGYTDGLKAVLNAAVTLPSIPYEELERVVDFDALTAPEAAVFISGVCASVAARYKYWAIHQSWIPSMRPKLPEKTLLQLTPPIRQLTIDCLAKSERLCTDSMLLLNVTGEELQASGQHLPEDRWEQALGHDMGL
ncbi:hypothetical protein [Pseudomonas sp. S1(2024)]|uniref:hypothetical protein n=1 Tax=Pseudomonas sp. S1(2024) TaxID=3390191 RepID=UPI00397A16CF